MKLYGLVALAFLGCQEAAAPRAAPKYTGTLTAQYWGADELKSGHPQTYSTQYAVDDPKASLLTVQRPREGFMGRLGIGATGGTASDVMFSDVGHVANYVTTAVAAAQPMYVTTRCGTGVGQKPCIKWAPPDTFTITFTKGSSSNPSGWLATYDKAGMLTTASYLQYDAVPGGWSLTAQTTTTYGATGVLGVVTVTSQIAYGSFVRGPALDVKAMLAQCVRLFTPTELFAQQKNCDKEAAALLGAVALAVFSFIKKDVKGSIAGVTATGVAWYMLRDCMGWGNGTVGGCPTCSTLVSKDPPLFPVPVPK